MYCFFGWNSTCLLSELPSLPSYCWYSHGVDLPIHLFLAFLTIFLHLSYNRVCFVRQSEYFKIVELNQFCIYITDMFHLSWIIILHLCYIYLYIYCVSFFLCFILFAHFLEGFCLLRRFEFLC